ncbi:hypothetical protein CAOG_00859 [Capsaspora owczarzaki ATCC 30864]|uniref:Uncharacterized protein n=1 Tax=Capsaspora owczarzaki (strain ATCC 30864) TaxID=595528 RepID=A0A0D2U2D1_CAPO3|nr:hypothetical protein CAOG_00859 [Capsaspora owczarzaki ATCC 30864]KJE89376.1 hypothetical protein CAOG_000859 [Capsaspora owczarzaki ATCC 30864]|eukprot:XP_004365730.1 hypothetical protein CAOG_00859 [Capsaspora owczarzaki ATCC 30864]
MSADDQLDSLLDEALEGFDEAAAAAPTSSGKSTQPESNAAAAAAAAKPAAAERADAQQPAGDSDEDFENSALAAQFQQQLLAMMQEMAGTSELDPEHAARLSEGLASMAAADAKLPRAGASSASSASGASKPSTNPFEQAIHEMQQNSQQLNNDETMGMGEDAIDALAEQLLAGMGGLGGGDDDDDDAGGMQAMMEKMMETVLNKDVLYQPMKSLSERYPEYLRENATKISAEDKTRYELQLVCMHKIVATFERTSESSSYKEILELVQEMQEHGSPPPEIFAELFPDMPASGGPLGALGMGGPGGADQAACTIM